MELQMGLPIANLTTFQKFSRLDFVKIFWYFFPNLLNNKNVLPYISEKGTEKMKAHKIT